ncbi:hypothetical protein I6F07_19475 [Ensifer sp. IC4062]|nr:hypothetical protein [Ensifer sp. IC4062]MCA1442356.1 hypothetical protein [Ensifer sp. IC4062]
MDWIPYAGIIAAVVFLFLARAKREEAIAAHRRQTQSQLQEAGFEADLMCFGAAPGSLIALDPRGQRIALSQSATPAKILSFRDLVAVEVLQNGASITKTNRGNQVAGAAVGALLLGPAGLLIGGLTGTKKSVQLVDKLSLKIYINDLVSPVHEVIFFNQPKSDPNSVLVKESAKLLDEWHGKLRTILHSQKTSGDTAPIGQLA